MATARPLVVAAGGTVLEEIQRVAAIAGSELDHVPDLSAARGRWVRAPLVVIEEEAVAERPVLPRRDSVVLVCKGTAGLAAWRRAATIGARRVFSLPEDESELTVAFADVADAPAESPGPVVALVGGRGGAGASVLATAVAVEADRGGPALLVDCDPLGGGLDLPLGLEHAEGLRWPEVRLTGRVSVPALVASLPSRGTLPVLSCGRSGTGPSVSALSAVVAAGRRAGRTVVCDLPRHLDEGALGVAAAADLVVLVVPVEFRACMAAKQVLHRLGSHADRLAIVASGHSIDGAPPSRTAELLGPPLLATLPPERRVAATLETGEFELPAKGALVAAARAVLAELRSATATPFHAAA
ncbi:septum site-determining protein Ssd [Amycolatopsis panacis]|uniref:Helicase n=1 Tax=Amycolatopsis panacis TaxID=2340917 RepID=A0A419I8J5_9PSEU|nr:septum site-determining protein Ssd [Amycolatopsis panacis]RJQ88522.1 helicase [Amycolatopsis panacis]